VQEQDNVLSGERARSRAKGGKLESAIASEEERVRDRERTNSHTRDMGRTRKIAKRVQKDSKENNRDRDRIKMLQSAEKTERVRTLEWEKAQKIDHGANDRNSDGTRDRKKDSCARIRKKIRRQRKTDGNRKLAGMERNWETTTEKDRHTV